MPGWNTSIACTNNGTGGTTTATGGVATIVLDPGATVTCTYTNTDVRSSIEIIKDVVDFNLDDASDAQDFAFTASGTPSTLAPSPFVLDDDAGAVGEDTVNADTQVFENVVPGTYTISRDRTTAGRLGPVATSSVRRPATAPSPTSVATTPGSMTTSRPTTIGSRSPSIRLRAMTSVARSRIRMCAARS